MIELSADLGEGTPREEDLWPMIGAASVACGGHTGDEESMVAAVRMAVLHRVVLGAHPSYPDRENFGRRTVSLEPAALADSLASQIARLTAVAERQGVAVRRVKPHGALYNDAHRDAALAAIVVGAVLRCDPALAIVCAESSEMARAAREAGLEVIREAFADRRYQSDGSLVPRTRSGALLTVAEAVEQAELLTMQGAVVAHDGIRVPISFETLCIHSDMDGAAERLRAIRQRLLIGEPPDQP